MRSEYWNFTVFVSILYIVAELIDVKIAGVPYLDYYGMGTATIILTIVTVVPETAVSIRRLHDINKSSWWILLALTVIGIIPLIYWACKKSDEKENRFGKNPLSN
jgi:uncharacterized membrane protein YhaH (DUF805 family)